MNGIFKKIYRDKIAGWSFTSSIFLLGITFVTILLEFRNLPPYLPLYNKLAWGYARLGHSYEFFLLPLLVLLFLIINSIIGVSLQNKTPLLSRFLFVTILCVAFFTAVFTLKLLLVIL